MSVYHELKNHYNYLKVVKSKIKDTDRDGIPDNLEIRSADGQLTTNPTQADINRALQEIENLEKKTENRINEIREMYIERDRVHQSNRSEHTR